MNRNIEELYKIYCERFNEFSDTYADGLTDNVRAAYVSLLFSEYKKDLKCITDFEKLQLRAKNKLFKAALRAQRKLERERRPEVDYDDELNNIGIYYTGKILEMEKKYFEAIEKYTYCINNEIKECDSLSSRFTVLINLVTAFPETM